jgi:hypothetical protein
MTDPAVAAIERLGVNTVQPPHAPRKIRLGRLDQQVIVVSHQAKGTQPPTLLHHLAAEPVQEALAVLAVQKDRLSPITTGGHVIDGTGEFES